MLLLLAGCAAASPEAQRCTVLHQPCGRGAGDSCRWTIRMVNDGQWCGFTLTVEGYGFTPTVGRQPQHGIGRVARGRDNAVIGYLPEAGFTGADAFELPMPGNVALTMVVDVRQ